MTIKLKKLRDMTPVKLSITVTPDLMNELSAYAQVYERSYEDKQPVTALIPSMLAGFLAADSGFKKARRELETSGH